MIVDETEGQIRILLNIVRCVNVFLDVDECSASIPVCDNNANCKNTRGSYLCSCKTGFTGDGKTCHGKLF